MGNNKVTARTTLTGVRDDGKIYPVAPLWVLINTGTVALTINGSYEVAPGDRFGVDLSAVGAGGWDVEQITEYEIKFKGSAAGDSSNTRGAQLIQTYITFPVK